MSDLLPGALLDPPRQYSLIPFWFWNDDLDEAEIVRQIDDFVAHGVYGFVIHPRVGLPRSLPFMSDELMHYYRVAIEAAAERDLMVLLYDEAMYPSGAAGGLVVQSNPELANRCLAKCDLTADEEPVLKENENLVAVVTGSNGQRMAVIDRPSGSYIRGIHLEDHDGPRLPNYGEAPEDRPPAGDILNPAGVQKFIEIVYDGYASHFSEYFGNTIIGIFTDEPNPLGKQQPDLHIWPGTTGILEHVNDYLGEDFTPHLPALWLDDEPNAEHHRKRYRWAIHQHLERVYYKRLSDWCTKHNLSLTGHPSASDDIGSQRYFQIPGQDTVWRWVMHDEPSALEGKDATQAKCSSSAMLHLGRTRNANECLGAYGHELTWQTMKWLVDWCLIRGVNMLLPHAFYYSVRGPRVDERPPDVGPNNVWWDDYKRFADYCRRISWLNGESQHICNIAVLGQADFLPWQAAKVLFQHQRDFNYLEACHLWDDAKVSAAGIEIAGMHYDVLVIDGIDIPDQATAAIKVLRDAGRVVDFDAGSPDDMLGSLDRLVGMDVSVSPEQPGLRVRHVLNGSQHVYMLCNESTQPITFDVHFAISGKRTLLDPLEWQMKQLRPDEKLMLEPYSLQLVLIDE